jgi:hypothetical protein
MNALERETAEELGRLALEVAAGDPHALRFCLSLSPIASTWDHVTDGDPIDVAAADAAFQAMVLDWPINPFVRTYATTLVPAMAAAISAWRCSTLPGCRIKAYDVLSEVWSAVAFILGGMARVNAVMPQVRAALVAQQTVNAAAERQG